MHTSYQSQNQVWQSKFPILIYYKSDRHVFISICSISLVIKYPGITLRRSIHQKGYYIIKNYFIVGKYKNPVSLRRDLFSIKKSEIVSTEITLAIPYLIDLCFLT